ncbi:MAG TPA: glycosyltransferase family 2 protein [Candidatus Nanoarchaeia archaeon]|nr:glycosyltransferase family 2 protein [Candidatus Nanoarchaeia archaeon]
MKSLSVFFPAYNDEGTIGKLVQEAAVLLPGIVDDYEIIVVDDCSPDSSGRIADALAKKNKHIRVIHHQENRGAGGALLTGYRSASKEYVFYTDGDAQYNLQEVRNLIPYLQKSDVIVGYRKKRQDPFIRILFSRIYHILLFFLFGLHLRDVDCSFKLIRKSLIDQVNIRAKTGFVDAELMWRLQQMRQRIIELPVTHYPRPVGRTQFFRFTAVYGMVMEAIKIRFNIR